MKGKVAKFNNQKGYGFITPDDGSKDIFVHYTGIVGEGKFKKLREGQEVEFEPSENDKGRIAINVTVTGDQNPKPKVLSETKA